MINKAVYTDDEKIVVIDDKGRLCEYEASDEVIELNQEFNNSEYLKNLKDDYDKTINYIKVNRGITIFVGLVNLGIAISLIPNLFGTESLLLNGVGIAYFGAVVIGVPTIIHHDNKKLKNEVRKRDFIDDEINNCEKRIHELLNNVRFKRFDAQKRRKIKNFDIVSKDLKNKINYELEDTNYNEKSKVYTLKPSKRR